MTVLHSPQPLTRPDAPEAELASSVRGSDRDAALAGRTAAAVAAGLLVQAVLLARTPPTWQSAALAALMLPLLAAGTRIVLLLDHASASIGSPAGRTQWLAGIETRRFWTFRARLWAYGTLTAFLVWSAAVQLTVH